MEIWTEFSSRVQIDIDFNTRREIPYLRAPMYYHLSLLLYPSPPSLHLEKLGTFATFPCFGDRWGKDRWLIWGKRDVTWLTWGIYG